MLRSGLRLGRLTMRQALIASGAVIVIGFSAYQAFQFGLYQPQITRTGSVTATNKFNPRQTATAQTRLAIIGRRSFWQVEVSPGAWKDCGSDCESVLRQSVFRE
jgi:hypothetical protein